MTALVPRSPFASVGPLLFLAALVAALFFNGVQLVFFASSMLLIVAWAGQALWGAYGELPLPSRTFGGLLLGFVLSLAMASALSPAPGIGFINTWWVGSVALVFFLGTLASVNRGARWRMLRRLWFGLAGLLALYAVAQQVWLHDAPRATFINRNNLAAFLNLALLPLLASVLHTAVRSDWHSGKVKLGTALAFVLLLAIMLVGSRGAILGLLLGTFLLAIVFWRTLGWRASLYLIALIAGAFLCSELLGGVAGSKSAALADPQGAGHSRWLIWQAAWAMLQDAPWHGIGPGLFWLSYPPYRAAADNSGGFYVHNDYLQLWLEGGWPTFIILLCLLALVAFRYARLLRSGPVAPVHEGSGLFAALLAVAFHSLLTFNFYQLPILIVMGALLARFDALTAGMRTRLQPATRMTMAGYRLIALSVLLLPTLYFSGLLGADLLRLRAERLAPQGDFLAAHRSLELAERLAPSIDPLFFLHADFLRRSLARLPQDAHEQRESLYALALEKLDAAQERNPLRPQVPFIRGELLLENSALAGAHAREQAHAAFARALALDPRFLPARLADARALREEGRRAAAHRVLMSGVGEAYPRSPMLFQYLRECSAGAGAEELERLQSAYPYAFAQGAEGDTSAVGYGREERRQP